MKRRTKNLMLNKKAISSLTSEKLTGGTRTSNLCSVGCSLAGGCGTTGPSPFTKAQKSGCACK